MTEKPEAEILRRFAKFAADASPHLGPVREPDVAIVASQALHYSALDWLAYEAEMKSMRALAYYCRVPPRVVWENRLAELGSPRLVIVPSAHVLSDAAWDQLIESARGGASVLLSGPVERDAYWRPRGRLAALGLAAEVAPIHFQRGEIRIGEMKIAVVFDAQRQAYAEALALPRGETYLEIAVGRGRLFVVALPVEMAEGLEAAAQVYTHALRRAGVEPPFTGAFPSPGVLIHAQQMEASSLYLIVSESAQKETIAIRDTASGARIEMQIEPGRARLLLIDRKTGARLAEH
jgi:hypothetical protein